LAALGTLDRLLDDFPFVDGASRAVALSALISPVARGAMAVVPLHAVTAPTSGTGKSFLIDVASGILTGDRAPVLSAADKAEETEKRLTAVLLDGQALVSLDNMNGELYSDLLCQAVERPLVSLRPLGGSQLMKIESRATYFATGNNLKLVSDMARRTIVCSLDPNLERPELREFNGNPFSEVISHRGRYIAAALTVVRAYVVAGYPGALPPSEL
jgi:putative DNA primase/helicase